MRTTLNSAESCISSHRALSRVLLFLPPIYLFTPIHLSSLVSMPCQRGPTRCAEPAFISGYSSKIIPGVPTARYPIYISVTSVGKRLTPFSFTFSSFPSRENIELNRRTFNEGYISFFQLAQSIADLMTELDDLESWLLQGTLSRSPSWIHLPPLTPQHPFSINNRA